VLTFAPLSKALLAWPEIGSRPVPVADLLPQADRDQLLGWEEKVLRDPADALQALKDSHIKRPHNDPVLLRCRKSM